MDILQAIKRNVACDFESKDQEKVMKHFRDKHNIEQDDTVPCTDT